MVISIFLLYRSIDMHMAQAIIIELEVLLDGIESNTMDVDFIAEQLRSIIETYSITN